MTPEVASNAPAGTRKAKSIVARHVAIETSPTSKSDMNRVSRGRLSKTTSSRATPVPKRAVKIQQLASASCCQKRIAMLEYCGCSGEPKVFWASTVSAANRPAFAAARTQSGQFTQPGYYHRCG